MTECLRSSLWPTYSDARSLHIHHNSTEKRTKTWEYIQPHDLLFYPLTMNCIHWIHLSLHTISVHIFIFVCPLFDESIQRNENVAIEWSWNDLFRLLSLVFSFKQNTIWRALKTLENKAGRKGIGFKVCARASFFSYPLQVNRCVFYSDFNQDYDNVNHTDQPI